EWPPKRGIAERKLYFQADGRLQFEPPSAGVTPGHDQYVSDPAYPVPYRQRPIDPTYQGTGWYTWQTEDQRFVHLRPDVLSYETEPLAEDVVIAGDIVAHLFATTTGTDSDWIVKLIDVYPEKVDAAPQLGGYQLMVACEVLRGRFRKS